MIVLYSRGPPQLMDPHLLTPIDTSIVMSIVPAEVLIVSHLLSLINCKQGKVLQNFTSIANSSFLLNSIHLLADKAL